MPCLVEASHELPRIRGAQQANSAEISEIGGGTAARCYCPTLSFAAVRENKGVRSVPGEPEATLPKARKTWAGKLECGDSQDAQIIQTIRCSRMEAKQGDLNGPRFHRAC